MTASQGFLGKFSIGSANPTDTRIRYVDEDFTLKGEVLDGNLITGVLDHNVELVRDGALRIDGPVNLIPNAVEMSNLLQWILGGTPSGSGTVSYPLTQANDLVSKYVTIDRVAKVFTYDGVKVNKATFRATQGGFLTLNLDLVGKTETVGNSGTFPSLSLNLANSPFVFYDLALTVGGTTVQAKEFTLTIDNMLNKERFFNSQTLVSADQQDRKITFSTQLPWGDYFALYSSLGAAGLAVVGTFTNGGAVLAFSMVKVSMPKKAPPTPGKTEFMLDLTGDARSSGATASLVTTLNPGPEFLSG